MRASTKRQLLSRNAHPLSYRWRASALGVLFAFTVIVSEPVVADDSEVKKTWDAAEVAVYDGDTLGAFGRMDDPKVQAKLAMFPTGTKFPTIIYLHGCSGLYKQSFMFWDLPERGYAVIAPDSFARSGRVATCGRTAAGRQIRQLRHAEIRFAARQALQLPWVDPDKLILFGHSQGGGAVASYTGDEFKARIASGTSCWRVGGPSPLLVVNFKKDPWITQGDSCGGNVDKFLRLSGKGHWPWGWPEAKKALFHFLGETIGANIR
jgi:hypothetical protein